MPSSGCKEMLDSNTSVSLLGKVEVESSTSACSLNVGNASLTATVRAVEAKLRTIRSDWPSQLRVNAYTCVVTSSASETVA